MGEYDAASLVGRMAGLSGRDPAPDRVTPAQLVVAFCGERADGMTADRGTSEKDGVKTSRGWCGLRGGRGESLAVGFDDGYDFLGYLGDRGWTPLPAKGDWPYVVYLATRVNETYAIASYCETDLTVSEFPSKAKFDEFYAGLKDAP